MEDKWISVGFHWHSMARIGLNDIMCETVFVVEGKVTQDSIMGESAVELETVERSVELEAIERSQHRSSTRLPLSLDVLDQEAVIARLKAWKAAKGLHAQIDEMCGDFLGMVITHLMSVRDSSTSAALLAAMAR